MKKKKETLTFSCCPISELQKEIHEAHVDIAAEFGGKMLYSLDGIQSFVLLNDGMTEITKNNTKQ